MVLCLLKILDSHNRAQAVQELVDLNHQDQEHKEERNLKLSLLEKQLLYESTREYHILKMNFSSGFCLSELKAVSMILTTFFNVPKPNRDEKRSSTLLLGWFINNWSLIEPFLPLIQLRDKNNRIIDGKREMIETGIYYL